MKKQKDYTIELLLFIFIIACLVSCSPKGFTGILSDCKGDTVVCAGRTIKVAGNVPKCGTMAFFKPTANRKKINAIILNKKLK